MTKYYDRVNHRKNKYFYTYFTKIKYYRVMQFLYHLILFDLFSITPLLLLYAFLVYATVDCKVRKNTYSKINQSQM